ncbi:hypothetical protein PTKIN_Ptkin08bG0062400 [Pterospermum kingtungense]
MYDELWKHLCLTEEGDDDILNVDESPINQNEESKHWLVGKLMTTRPFNKESMMATLKFQGGRDKARILEGAPWSFDKHLLLLHKYMGDWRPDDYEFKHDSF